MSLILISEHSKSICEFRVTKLKKKKGQKIKDRMDGVEYCSCRRKSGVDLARGRPYELPGPREHILKQ